MKNVEILLLFSIKFQHSSLILAQTCCKDLQLKQSLKYGKATKCDACCHHFITLTFLFVILWKNVLIHWDTNYAFCDYDFLLYKLGMLAHVQLLQAICIQLFACDILSKKLHGNLISPPERSNHNLWTRVRWSPVTSSPDPWHVVPVSPCPLIFHVLSALCLSNFIFVLSISFTSSFFFSIPLFISRLFHLISGSLLQGAEASLLSALADVSSIIILKAF